MQRFKIIISCIGILLALIIVFQNTASVETRFLFITIQMPRAALLILTFILGLLVGLGLSLGTFKRKSTPK